MDMNLRALAWRPWPTLNALHGQGIVFLTRTLPLPYVPPIVIACDSLVAFFRLRDADTSPGSCMVQLEIPMRVRADLTTFWESFCQLVWPLRRQGQVQDGEMASLFSPRSE